MPGAPRKTRPAAALHSLNPPERARRKAARPGKNRKELKKPRGHQLATAAWPVESNGRPRYSRNLYIRYRTTVCLNRFFVTNRFLEFKLAIIILTLQDSYIAEV